MACNQDGVFFIQQSPEGPARTRIALTSCFPRSTVESKDFDEIAEQYYHRLDTSVPEDIWISEEQQAGLESPFSSTSRLSSEEPLVHSIANWVLDRVLDDRDRKVTPPEPGILCKPPGSHLPCPSAGIKDRLCGGGDPRQRHHGPASRHSLRCAASGIERRTSSGPLIDAGARAVAHPRRPRSGRRLRPDLPDRRSGGGGGGVRRGRHRLRPLRPPSLLIDMSTVEPEHSRRMAARLRAERAMGWLDAPISGGAPAAREGRMAVMVGGDEDGLRPGAPGVERARGALHPDGAERRGAEHQDGQPGAGRLHVRGTGRGLRAGRAYRRRYGSRNPTGARRRARRFAPPSGVHAEDGGVGLLGGGRHCGDAERPRRDRGTRGGSRSEAADDRGRRARCTAGSPVRASATGTTRSS